MAQAIRTVFARFDELGSARQVWIWWREQGLKLPVRRIELRSQPVVWMPPVYRTILQFLRHPIYAGAYVFGRSKTVRTLDADDARTLRVRRVVFTPVRLNSGRTYPYGFGWGVDSVAGQKVQRHGGAWQGFQTYIARYLGDGLTIAVLANLAQSRPNRFVDSIAAIMDPKLAPPPEKPLPDREAAVTTRLRDLLAAIVEGRLVPEDFAYVRAGFFPATPRAYAEMLAGLGAPTQVDLYGRREMGDDRLYRYRVGFGEKAFDVRLGLAPDDKISELTIMPRLAPVGAR